MAFPAAYFFVFTHLLYSGVLLLLIVIQAMFLLLQLLFNCIHLLKDVVLLSEGEAHPKMGKSLIMLKYRKLRFSEEKTALFLVESAEVVLVLNIDGFLKDDHQAFRKSVPVLGIGIDLSITLTGIKPIELRRFLLRRRVLHACGCVDLARRVKHAAVELCEIV